MSKTYGLPGIRIGWIATQEEELIEKVCAVREQLTICNSAVGEEIAKHVLQRKEESVGEVREDITTNFEILEAWMREQEYLEWIPPKGGVVCFPKVVGVSSADDLCRRLVEEYKTFVVPGSSFNMDQHFRLGFGGETEELKRGSRT